MIEISLSKGILTYKQKWFSARPSGADAVRLIAYNQSRSTGQHHGYKRKSFFTRIIDLNLTDHELLRQCTKNTRYKIKRAQREDIEFMVHRQLDTFVEFYNSFAASKNLRELNAKDFVASYSDHVLVTKAMLRGESLVMHCYLSDREEQRVRLLSSVSLFRLESSSERRNLLGRANRYLHYCDMLHFKSQGFSIYDLGGYAEGTEDPVLRKINDFKDGFGGVLLEESNYMSLPLYCLTQAARIFRAPMRGARKQMSALQVTRKHG